MPPTRLDLLALTDDDLAALANRGLTKRAQREVESSELTASWEVGDDGTLRATWSDGVTCLLPGGRTLKEGTCTCDATELCRHLLRTVLAWQERIAGEAAEEGEPTPPGPWDPGGIADAVVEAQASPKVRQRAATLWAQGVLAELLRTEKPSARFYAPGHTVRFPVPDDLRYALCSCAAEAPCEHAVLAAWAFRQLGADRSFGIVSIGAVAPRPPVAALEAAADCVRELLRHGLSSLPPSWRDGVQRVAAESRAAGAMWPAQILEEIAEDFHLYHAHDAAFSPGDLLSRAGELLVRCDAIAAGKAPVPLAFLSGLAADRETTLGNCRLVGLGAVASETRRRTRLTIYLQDQTSGHMLTVGRDIAEDPDQLGGRKPFHQLGHLTAAKDASYRALAAGQLTLQGGKRLASGKLLIGRARSTVNPQAFLWERLKAPLLVEDFRELRARLQLLPPASFRPRQVAADFHVCPLSRIESAAYDPAANAIVARLVDAAGDFALLSHPWSTRGERGAEELLDALRSGDPPSFVAGHVSGRGGGLVIQPTAMVFAAAAGRRAVLPYLGAAQASAPIRRRQESELQHRGAARFDAAAEVARTLVLQGLGRLRQQGWPGWTRAADETAAHGYHRMAALLGRCQEENDALVAIQTLIKVLRLDHDLADEPASISAT